MRTHSLIMIGLCGLLLSCNGKEKDKPDVDTDTDADSDADSDTDTDTDAQFEDNLLLDCTEVYETPDPVGCLTDSVECNTVIYGNNLGGSTHYECGNNDQFEQCSGSAGGSDCDGPERVYTLQAPLNITHFTARLTSCTDSWLFYHQSNDECITPDSGLPVGCSYATSGSLEDQSTIYQKINEGGDHQITFVVEGFQNEGGNFALYVECYEDENG